MLQEAGRGKRDFGLGAGTRAQADELGAAWVGDGWRWSSDGKAMLSADGSRVYRPPAWKPKLGLYQANFVHAVDGQVTRIPIGNGHLDILDG